MTSITTAFVQRLNDGVADALLAGAPDVDAMFEQAVNTQQMFHRISGTATDSESFTITYNDQSTALIYDSAQDYTDQLLASIQTFDALATISGEGTEQSPWLITLDQAERDYQDNYFPLVLTNGVSSDFTAPSDIADAAAETRASADLDTVGSFQRVYYNYTAEQVSIHGRAGNDTFISDDTAASVQVYGDQGNDNFLIGRVLRTETVTVDGRSIQVINDNSDGLGEGITAGVRFNSYFYGGNGDDYFEVNHNVGALELYGEAGDDTFFLKAHQVIVPAGDDTDEIVGGTIITGAGDDQGIVDDTDEDILLDYIENNRVEIFGGAGFDTIVIAGTALDDKFYIYTDNDAQQYLFGAGIKLDNIDSIERLALVTVRATTKSGCMDWMKASACY